MATTKTRRQCRPRPEIAAQPRVIADGKAVIYDPETRDFAMYLDGELIGFARTYQEAEASLDELRHEILVAAYGPAAIPVAAA